MGNGKLPIDNNHIENQIRPIAVGRNNWLFAGSLRAGKRGAAIMRLIHSAKPNGHDPYTCLRDVLTRLTRQPWLRRRGPYGFTDRADGAGSYAPMHPAHLRGQGAC